VIPEAYPHVGTGWRFPVAWNATGAVVQQEGPAKLAESIRLILRTAVGSRVMRPGFGAGVDRYVFDPRTEETCFRLAFEVRQALLLWEPRILVDSVDAVPAGDDGERIDVTIVYRVDPHRRPSSLVLPFHAEAAP
jgi:hypothetical protein